MYAALWRVLPGPWWVRVLILLVAVAVILTVCVYWVFPWIQPIVSPPPPETVGT
jgi:predicted membrane protein